MALILCTLLELLWVNMRGQRGTTRNNQFRFNICCRVLCCWYVGLRFTAKFVKFPSLRTTCWSFVCIVWFSLYFVVYIYIVCVLYFCLHFKMSSYRIVSFHLQIFRIYIATVCFLHYHFHLSQNVGTSYNFSFLFIGWLIFIFVHSFLFLSSTIFRFSIPFWLFLLFSCFIVTVLHISFITLFVHLF